MMCDILFDYKVTSGAANTNRMEISRLMKYANMFAVVGASVALVGCASAPRVVVDEPLGPAPAGVAQGTGEGSLVIYSARMPADVDVYMAEWRWNNDFGRNAFLYERAHTDYTIYLQNGEVF